MLLLRDVHYVLYDKTCVTAFVSEQGIDSADLHVYLDWFHQPPPGVELLGNIMMVTGKRYDERGAAGTWHTENDCPWRKT